MGGVAGIGVATGACIAVGKGVAGDVEREVGARVDGGVDFGAVSSPPHVANSNGPNPKSKSHKQAVRMLRIIARSDYQSILEAGLKKSGIHHSGTRKIFQEPRVDLALEWRFQLA